MHDDHLSFFISSEEAGERLDKVLAELDAGVGGGAGGAHVSRAHLTVVAAGIYVSAEHRLGDE